jgi:hypothetical protein
MNTDEEKELSVKTDLKSRGCPGQRYEIAGRHIQLAAQIPALSLSVFIRVHLWFQGFSSCA